METPEDILAAEKRKFSTFSIRKPKVAVLIGVILALWGILSAIAIPKESSPYIAYGVVVISTVYTGASAADIDSLVTREIEDNIKDIKGLNKYSSVSRNSISSITLEFEPGTDMTQAMGDVRSKVDEAKTSLPAEIDGDPFILEIDSSIGPFLSVILSGPYSPVELTDFAEELKTVLKNVPSIANVELRGNTEREITVKVDPRRLEALGISLNDIVNVIRASHLDVPVGDFTINGLEYSLRFVGKHQTVDDVRSIIIANLKNSGYPSLLTIGDIAEVTENPDQDNTNITRFIHLREPTIVERSFPSEIRLFLDDIGKDIAHFRLTILIPILLILLGFLGAVFPFLRIGEKPLPRLFSLFPAIALLFTLFLFYAQEPRFESREQVFESAIELSLSKKSATDILAVDKNVRVALKEFAAEHLPADVKTNYISDSATVMREDYRSVIISGLQSFFIVLFFILLFVGITEGLLASVVIPLSFLVTIGVLQMMGRTLNFMTNFSMILSLGILIDTAVVIVQGTHARIKMGFSPRDSAILALHEFRVPLISGMLTTVAVFIPLLMLPGVLGQFLIFIPVTVITVLTIALGISLILLPAYAATAIPDPRKERKKKTSFLRLREFAAAFRTSFDCRTDRVVAWYEQRLRWLISKRKRRLGTFAVALVFFILSFRIPIAFELFPSGDAFFMNVSLEMPQGSESTKTLQSAVLIENAILRQPEVRFIRSVVNDNTGDIYVELLPNDDREIAGLRTSKDLEQDLPLLLEPLAKQYGGSVRVQSAADGPPAEAPVAFRVITRDKNKLPEAEAFARELTDVLQRIPGTSGVKNNIEKIPGEFRFRVDRAKAVALGLNPDMIPGLVRTALKGSTAATITRDNRDIDIKVKFDNEEIAMIEDLERLKAYTPAGTAIDFGQVLIIEREDALSAISRQDGNIAFTVSSLLGKGGNAQRITTEFLKKIETITIPEGLSIADAGENQENAALLFSLATGLVMAILIMFFILVVQFNALYQPIIILFTILFAQIGVAAGLYITDTPRSLPYLIGIISLAGIVVNNAIILVDQMNNNRDRMRKEGVQNFWQRAVLEAATSRVLPVVLTTLTTVSGIIPLIFQDVFWAGLSYTIVFGLSFATILTLFLTPALYIQIETEPGVTTVFIAAILALGIALFSLIGGQVFPAAITLVIAAVFFLLFRWLAWRKDKKTLSPLVPAS